AKGGPKMSAGEKKELAMLPTKLQRAASRLSEMHTLISNLMNAYHQMAMGSIGHIR
ncbi:MAG: hypothetical protein H6Q89_2478, partial [Myxococcaceae bacterium]|nr:hypothetical protein [Myxococcaceae bacterium]